MRNLNSVVIKLIGWRLAVLWLTAALGGCASLLVHYGALNEEDTAAILADGEAIVIARLTAETEDEPVDAITGSDGIGYRLTLVDLGSGIAQEMGPVFRASSPEARSQGWVYFTVKPGSYFLNIDPPNSTSQPVYRNSYRFAVSKGTVNYVGSFHAKCITTWGIFERVLAECSLTYGVADETELGGTVASRWLSQTNAFRSNLARPYEAQASAEELAAARPVAVTATTSVWKDPDWDRIGENTEPPLLGPGDFSGLGGGYPPEGVGVLIAVGLVVWGAAELVDVIDDAATRREWAPCINSLAEKVNEFDLSKLIWNELAARAMVGGLVPENASGDVFPLPGVPIDTPHRSTLRLEVQRIGLADCAESLSVCVELAVRATLVATDGGRSLYDAVHLYTGPLRAGDHAIWELPTKARAQCHMLSAMCVDQGWPLLENEIRIGVTEMAGAIVTDLLLASHERAPEPPPSPAAGTVRDENPL